MTMTALYLAIGTTVFLSCSLLLMLVFMRSSSGAQRLYDVVAGVQPAPRGFKQKELLEDFLLKFARSVRLKFGIRTNVKLADRLLSAGIRDAGADDLFFAAQCLTPLVGIFAGSFIPDNTLFGICALAALGYTAPNLWLTQMIRRRKQRILHSMPDAIDLLVICVDAGLGLDQAILRVGQELAISHPDIHVEFNRVHMEQRAGRPRLEAWQGLATRTRIAEFVAFTSMLTQADRFGTPIAKALSRFADDMRLSRRQRVEEAAAKTKIKIIFPLVFCVFPTLFIVLLAPALINIATELKGIGR
jgi:tight adherence protein C